MNPIECFDVYFIATTIFFSKKRWTSCKIPPVLVNKWFNTKLQFSFDVSSVQLLSTMPSHCIYFYMICFSGVYSRLWYVYMRTVQSACLCIHVLVAHIWKRQTFRELWSVYMEWDRLFECHKFNLYVTMETILLLEYFLRYLKINYWNDFLLFKHVLIFTVWKIN